MLFSCPVLGRMGFCFVVVVVVAAVAVVLFVTEDLKCCVPLPGTGL